VAIPTATQNNTISGWSSNISPIPMYVDAQCIDLDQFGALPEKLAANSKAGRKRTGADRKSVTAAPLEKAAQAHP